MDKRIWIINQFANTNEMPGHTRQFELSKFLSKKGFLVSVFSSDFNLSLRTYFKKGKFLFYKKEILNNVRWIWLSVIRYEKNNWKRYINIISFDINLSVHLFIKILLSLLFKRKPSLILASSPQLPASFCALLISKIFRIPFIFEVRDLWPTVLVDLGNINKENLLIKFLFFIEKLLFLFSDAIVVLSKGSVDYVNSKGGRNIYYFPNGSNLDFFKFVSLPKENKNFSSERPFKIIYSGAHGIANGLDNVIKAAKYFSHLPIKIFFVGDGPEKEKLIFLAKNNKSIVFNKPIPKSKMPKYLSKADAILVSLADVELFKYGVSPNKLFDAYSIGRPVITTIPGLINFEVEKYNLGVTSIANDPKKLADAILALYKKPRDVREKMGKAARRHAEDFYSKDLIFKKYYELINKVINQN